MPLKDAELIPQTLDGLTGAWLTEALGEAGLLTGARVSSVEVQPIGEGEGFLGIVARLHLDYEGEAGRAPRTVIAKLPIDVAKNRSMGELMGVYWREIHFYEELSSEVPVRTPGHIHGVMTMDPMRTRQYAFVKMLDRLPGFIVDPMMRYAKQSVSESPHRYLLLIEDLAGMRVGDQVGGGSPEACAPVLDAIARVHGHFWGDPRLRKLAWLADQDVTPHIRHRMYLEGRAALLEQHGRTLGDVGRRLIDFNDQHGALISRRVHREAPETLIHCDLRLDNVFFDDSRADAPVVLADWQLVGRGAAGYDVAYLLGGALPADTPRDVEMDLVRGYHKSLCDAGVGGYSFDRLLRDYRRGLLAGFQIVCTTDQMSMGEERGADLIDLWIERSIGRLEGLDLATLL